MADPGLRLRLQSTAPIALDLALECAPGELVAIIGPSGAGKSTTLRAIAGLHHPTSGSVVCGGQVWLDTARGLDLPAHRRRVGLVFQDYALFPHMTALGNVMAAMGHLPAAARAPRAAALLARVHLAGLEERRPAELSGGQQQRVALARALAPRPSVLLLDEAFASLDARLREKVRDDTLHVLQEAGIATLLVTHDAEEAMFMGDRIALMREGRILQVGVPEALYLAPVDRYVAGFLGEVNQLPARIQAGQAETALGALPAPGFADGAEVEVLIRPEGLRLGAEGQMVEVEAFRLLGSTTLAHLALPDGAGGLLHLHARLPPGRQLRRGERIAVVLDPERAFVFPRIET